MTDKATPEQFASADEFLNEKDVEFATVPSAVTGGKPLRIRSVTAGDIIEWSEANEGEAKRTAGLRLIIKSVVDGAGNLQLTDKNLEQLKNKTHKNTENIVKAILKLNGMQVKGQTTEAEDKAKKD